MNKAVLKLGMFTALVCFGAAVQAQPLRYTATGTLDPSSLSFGGFFIDSPYTAGIYETASGDAGQGAAVDAMLARPNFVSQTVLAPYTHITAQFGYNPAAPALSTSTNALRTISSYAADDITATLSGAGVSAVDLRVTDATISVITRETRASLSIFGTISSAGFGYADAAPEVQLVDLAAAIRSDPNNTFDLTGFSSLPVRLTSPQSFALVDGYGLASGKRSNVAPFTSPLPNPLLLADYDNYFLFEGYFEGRYAVSVDAADYASTAAYEAASAWVGSHVQQITYGAFADYNITALQVSSVPEPASYLLLAAGLLAVASRARVAAAARPARGA